MREPWFGPRRYGYGLGPTSPRGFTATAIFLVVLLLAPAGLSLTHAPAWMIPTAIVLLVLGFGRFAIAKSDGSPWRWRWGGR